MRLFFFTTLALLAFAGNSVLCRLALGEQAIDAASFTFVRLLSGIVMLALLMRVVHAPAAKSARPARGHFLASFMLFIYALTFSYAYRFLDTGSGALILFATVQITMLISSILQGHKVHVYEGVGLALAFAGFVYLLLPGAAAPSMLGFVLMLVAGIAWAIYTLLGQQSSDALADTAYNFYRTWPFLLLLLLLVWLQAEWTLEGVVLAVLSGAVTSGLGYALWYRALTELSSLQAAVLQLTVPVIASLGGLLFANETLTMRLVIASAGVLLGVFMVILAKHRPSLRS